MRYTLLLCCLISSHLSFASSIKSPEQEILSTVNEHWKEVALTPGQAIEVKKCQNHEELIQLHLKLVTEHLIEVTSSLSVDATTKQRRLTSLFDLKKYYERNLFPVNNKTDFAIPIFVDDAGTHCAVGYLILASGHDDIVKKIAEENNLGYVNDLQFQFEALGDWAKSYGFSIEELAWIQPIYGPHTCHPEIEPGEIIHNSCFGECAGEFYPNYFTELNLSAGDVISIGNFYEWNNDQWELNEYAECLCAGHYKQEYIIYSTTLDSFYTASIEVDILEPDSMVAFADITGQPEFCQAYIIPGASGGIEPYTFEVLDTTGISVGLGPLCQGEYYLVTTDANGCEVVELIQVFTTQPDCQSFCVTDIQMYDSIPGYMIVTLFLEGDFETFVNYPYFSAVVEEQGDTVATGNLNFFGQFGGTSQEYYMETTLDSLPNNFIATLVFNYDTNQCILPYPCLTSSIPSLDVVDLLIYPNPFHDEVIIQTNEPFQSARLIMYNGQGQIVKSNALVGDSPYVLQREGLPAGQYFREPLKTPIFIFI